MPAIFSEQQKEKLREQLLITGFELLKQFGYRKMTIDDITKKCAIAKGTFYRFFKSKEDFIYELMIYERDKEKQALLDALDSEGHLSQSAFKNCVKNMFHNSVNVFSFMTQEEITLLQTSWPEEYLLNVDNDEKTSNWILSFISDQSPGLDWRFFANYMKSIAIVEVYKSLLNPETADAFLDQLIDDMICYIWNS